MNARTPGPWKVGFRCSGSGWVDLKDANDTIIASVRAFPFGLTGMAENFAINEANAEFIVRACNSHNELVAALCAAEQTLTPCSDESRCEGDCAWHQVRAALAKVQS